MRDQFAVRVLGQCIRCSERAHAQGLQCAGNKSESARDPREVEIQVIDFLKKGTDVNQAQDKWYKVHATFDLDWNHRWELKEFDINQRLVKKIRLYIKSNWGDAAMQLG